MCAYIFLSFSHLLSTFFNRWLPLNHFSTPKTTPPAAAPPPPPQPSPDLGELQGAPERGTREVRRVRPVDGAEVAAANDPQSGAFGGWRDSFFLKHVFWFSNVYILKKKVFSVLMYMFFFLGLGFLLNVFSVLMYMIFFLGLGFVLVNSVKGVSRVCFRNFWIKPSKTPSKTHQITRKKP